MLVSVILSFSWGVKAAWPHGGPQERAHCTACHDAHQAVGPGLTKSQGICLSCHSVQLPQGLWPGYDAFAESAHAGYCQECHEPHGMSDEFGAIPHLARLRGADLCFTCHGDLAQAFADSRELEERLAIPSRHHVEDADSGVDCVNCHNPHLVQIKGKEGQARVTDPKNPANLVRLYDRSIINRFCLRCHDGSIEGAPNILDEIKGGPPTTGFLALTGERALHAVHLNKTHRQHCLQCHEPHANQGSTGVNRGRLLHDIQILSYQDGYPGYNSCATSCHGVRCGSCHQTPPLP